MMPLTMANPGECYTIRKVGGKEETRKQKSVPVPLYCVYSPYASTINPS